MRLQGLSDNTCQVLGPLQMAGSFVYFKLGLLCLTCFFLTPFNKFSTPHGFFLSSYSHITQFFPPTSSPTLNSRQQVGWPPNVTTESMKSKGQRFHGFAARSSDVFLFSEPETPASTHQVAQARPTQVRQWDMLAVYPEVLPPPTPITSGHIRLCSLPPSHLL